MILSKTNTLLVINFGLLVKEYFPGFNFRDFNTQIWKKIIKLRDLRVINVIIAELWREKIWLSRDRTPRDRRSAPQAFVIHMNCGVKNYMKEDHRSYIGNFSL